jgi:NAD(P)-dependent dehydrogenase (short-subunit alcohol dehydrogenase family)
VFADGPVDGRRVLVTGGGGAVGHYAIELAKHGGATVIATASIPDKQQASRAAGADHGQLVEAAVAAGMTSLALTDRDGLYGAVKFVRACDEAGVAPVLGVDLAVEPVALIHGPSSGAVRPSRRGVRRFGGGASVDPRHPRVTVLALAADPPRAWSLGWGGGGCAGW